MLPDTNDNDENANEEINKIDTTYNFTIDKFSTVTAWATIPVTTKEVPTSIPMETATFASKNHFDVLFNPVMTLAMNIYLYQLHMMLTKNII
jgi:hypothetical protein